MIYGYARVSTKGQAREKGIRVDGRPKKEVPNEVFQNFLEKQKGGEMTVVECCSVLNISRSTWYNLSNGCTTA